ncbi:hypothetical protein [Staphylococcus intermedius]|uniref:Uncharacterized protein n=1 Tax=Staphylococcus intermedius NCTC 11048 TaxID=1141106 RepID=A0A380G484_STAIN|nr:hypothetical protein [Staphylococcus intermedius]PCF64350.1 hypothetical protein B5C04_10320 [Staphylococcus intermedius]PCF79066.1 hypothetical protein B4W74_10670 [Staphylococcus intermedius]PCF80039.1 hypothetical protein B4W70_10310 [Staphylococcus intermedius]PCF89300.1 hypothetical protein B4W75_00235 [Staphylococcus intermedius]PNZ53113.1 hypothetical protein CD138_05185 [Staphylococcus intermedius NCTC 11048]
MFVHFNSILLGISCLIAVLLSSFIIKRLHVHIAIKVVIVSVMTLILFIAIYGIFYLLLLR